VAQLGARLDGIEEVVGSNPIGSTMLNGVFCVGLPIPFPSFLSLQFLLRGPVISLEQFNQLKSGMD
jgi:hypothetical protein